MVNMKKAVLLIHGLWDTDEVFSTMQHALQNLGFTCVTISWRPNNGALTIADYALQLDAAVAPLAAQYDQLDIVAFSMGGIIAREYLQATHQPAVRQLITIGSPHHGSSWANAYSPVRKQRPGVWSLRPNSPLLKRLNEQFPKLAIPVTSIYSTRDGVILPKQSSHLPDATNIQCKVWGHDRLLKSPIVIQAVAESLGTH